MSNKADIAACIHADMCNDERNGYSWEPRWGGDHPDGSKTLRLYGRDYSYRLGSYDCSSSVCTAWQLALQGTSYEGCLDDATYTGNMRSVFLDSGLFFADRTPAKRGDIYLDDDHHTAMCQDGGDDGVYGYDALSEFSSNENGGAYGGQVGDQTEWESHIRSFYERPWYTTLHYNGLADDDEGEDEEPAEDDSRPEQCPGDPENDAGLLYRVHAQDLGWLSPVRDGQVAGTVGYGLRMEALKITPPEGWVLYALLHVQDRGWLAYHGIKRGESSEEGSSPNDPLMGTVGQSLRIEDVIIGVTKRPEGDKRRLRFRVHQEGIGWKAWTDEGCASGTDGMGLRLEAIRMMLA